jgi:hypothetical protein
MSSDLCYEVGPWCDVFTLNNYDMSPPAEIFDTILKRTGKSVMVGEFHFGATDRGLPSSGLRRVVDQQQRGVAYRRYVERCAAHPACVGAQYFQFADEPFLGRFDGENYPIGLTDVCLTPYTELLQAAAISHERMYAVKAGNEKPYDVAPVELPRIF